MGQRRRASGWLAWGLFVGHSACLPPALLVLIFFFFFFVEEEKEWKIEGSFEGFKTWI